MCPGVAAGANAALGRGADVFRRTAGEQHVIDVALQSGLAGQLPPGRREIDTNTDAEHVGMAFSHQFDLRLLTREEDARHAVAKLLGRSAGGRGVRTRGTRLR